MAWAQAVCEDVLQQVSRIPGFKDEPIPVGPHARRRSIRLNEAWRAFYRVTDDGGIEIVTVEDVNKHKCYR